jgi:hypothetical protein
MKFDSSKIAIGANTQTHPTPTPFCGVVIKETLEGFV